MSWSYFQRDDNYGSSESVWQKKSFNQRAFRWAINYHGCGIRWRLYHFNLKYSVEKDKHIQELQPWSNRKKIQLWKEFVIKLRTLSKWDYRYFFKNVSRLYLNLSSFGVHNTTRLITKFPNSYKQYRTCELLWNTKKSWIKFLAAKLSRVSSRQNMGNQRCLISTSTTK